MTFLALNYKIPATPSRYRVAVWKALKELGAVYLQDGVAAVPQQEGAEPALRELRQQILACGGQAALLQVEFCDQADEAATLQAFAAARTEEYAALRADAERLKAQLEWERGRADGGDEERCAAELRRLKRRLDAVIERDHWQAAGREEAQQAVQELVDALPDALATVRRPGRPVGRTTMKPAAKSPARRKTKTKPSAQKPIPAPVEPEPTPQEDTRREMPVFLF